MHDSAAPPPIHTNPWQQAHGAAHALHDALRALGIPETVLGTLTARQDVTGAHRVVIPPLPIADAQRLVTALRPYLGPDAPYIGRPDAAPITPGQHP